MTKAAGTTGQPVRDARADALVASFEQWGYARVAPAILQPAEPFLDLSGEDIRKRMYLTADPQGHELCLRPDLTIPVSRHYLASEGAGTPQGFCYLGAVFRHRENEPSEFLQAGIESFARTDVAAADAEMLALGLEATSHYGLAAPEIRVGDVGLFRRWSRHSIWRQPGSGAWSRTSITNCRWRTTSTSSASGRPTVVPNIKACWRRWPAPIRAPRTHSSPTSSRSPGSAPVGGRSVGEIADRFLEQAALGAQTSLPRETRALIERFLAVAGDPDEAVAELRALAQEAGLALDGALDLFESRTGFLAARGIDVGRIRFTTAFGRGVDYYTGFVFELHDPRSPALGQLVAGGRYDGLLMRIGSPTAIPAVGFAAWIERLTSCGGGA